METGSAFSLPSPGIQLPSSEEVNLLSIKAVNIEDSPLLSSVYEELVKVITCAVLNIDWVAKKQGAHPKSKLDKRFLSPKSLPPPWGLPFLPDLHKEGCGINFLFLSLQPSSPHLF